MHVNDIAENLDLNVTVKIFADDCAISEIVTNSMDQVPLNEHFCKVVEWCERWQMVINTERKFVSSSVGVVVMSER